MKDGKGKREREGGRERERGGSVGDYVTVKLDVEVVLLQLFMYVTEFIAPHVHIKLNSFKTAIIQSTVFQLYKYSKVHKKVYLAGLCTAL